METAELGLQRLRGVGVRALRAPLSAEVGRDTPRVRAEARDRAVRPDVLVGSTVVASKPAFRPV